VRRSTARACGVFFVSLLATAFAGEGGERPAAAQDSVDKDYASELPRIPLEAPAESQKEIELATGFRIQLAAAEPLLRSPVAIDFDEDGRLYVAEFPEYNQYGNASARTDEKGCVRLLEDAQGDCVYEKSTLFAANVPMATAVACWDGGVYVGSAPDLLYLKDTDGDGKADVRRVVFTGFGKDAGGEGMLNSFRWGLDNRFHVATSLDGGTVRAAGRPGAAAVSVRGQTLLFDPRGETFELAGGGGQHGMSRDDWGRTYVCGNSDPFHVVMYDSRYLRRNPYLEAPAAAINIAPAGKYTRLHRISPVEPWRVLRTRLRSLGLIPGSDEGGKPSGFFTGATGVTVYRGDAFPQEYRGNLFVGDVSNNVIHRALAEPTGLLVTARSLAGEHEFLASRDTYFRPVQMANGPDGCLWIIDMYRELIEGAAFLAPPILKHMDVASGIDRGRIWRVVPEGQVRKFTKLSRSTTPELVALLEHPSGWQRDTASRLLYQRQDRSAAGPLRQLAASSKAPLYRTHALYALNGLGVLEPSDVLAALSDPAPGLREHGLRLAERFAGKSLAIEKRMLEMADDGDPLVRYQLAFSLGALPGSTPASALAALAARDAADSWMRLALLSSVLECAGAVFDTLARNSAFCANAQGRTFLRALAAQVGAAGRADDLAAIKRALDGPLREADALSRQIVMALLSRASPAAQKELAGAGGRVVTILALILAEARDTAGEVRKPAAERAAALRSLRFAPFDDVKASLADSLQSRQPPAVQAAAIETLARFREQRAASILLQAWPSLSPKLRATAVEALLERPAWVEAFLTAVETGQVSRGDLDPARVDLLKRYPVESVRKRAAGVFSGSRPGRQEVIAAYQKALKTKGNLERGKAVFKDYCSSCHRLELVGQPVGADLSAVRDRGLDAVLVNILDPNREVMPQYQTYVVMTSAGTVLTGMITDESANSLTIRNPDGGQETVLRHQIEEMRSTGLSYMPEGLEKQIDVQAMADLLSYLNSVGGR
jgi:putative membrane-bound dehydrogenase-like protein